MSAETYGYTSLTNVTRITLWTNITTITFFSLRYHVDRVFLIEYLNIRKCLLKQDVFIYQLLRGNLVHLCRLSNHHEHHRHHRDLGNRSFSHFIYPFKKTYLGLLCFPSYQQYLENLEHLGDQMDQQLKELKIFFLQNIDCSKINVRPCGPGKPPTADELPGKPGRPRRPRSP